MVILEEDLPLAAVEPVYPEPDQQQLGVRLAGHHPGVQYSTVQYSTVQYRPPPCTPQPLIGGYNGDGGTSAARNQEPSILITEPG